MLSPSMVKMWISFVGIILLILAMGLIFLSRTKLHGIFAGIIAILAYAFFIFGSIIIFYIVFSGPTG